MIIEYDGQERRAKGFGFSTNETIVYLDVSFDYEGKTYHAANRTIELYDYADGPVNCFYSLPSFHVDDIDLDDSALCMAVANYLSFFKLYVHHFSIAGKTHYVSYNSHPEHPVIDMKYQPAGRTNYIFVKVVAQTEDDVKLEDMFDMRIKGPVEFMSDEKLLELGYNFKDCISIDMTTAMGFEEFPKPLRDIVTKRGEDFHQSFAPNE